MYSCAWHGCLRCFSGPDIMPTGCTADEENRRAKRKIEWIKAQGLDIHVIWECEIHQMLDENKEMKNFFAEQFDLGPICIRNALYGGRTGPLKLFAQANESNGRVIKDKGRLNVLCAKNLLILQ